MSALTRGPSEPVGLVKDVHPGWELPLALRLPAFCALLVPIPRMALVHRRVVFTAFATGLRAALS